MPERQSEANSEWWIVGARGFYVECIRWCNFKVNIDGLKFLEEKPNKKWLPLKILGYRKSFGIFAVESSCTAFH